MTKLDSAAQSALYNKMVYLKARLPFILLSTRTAAAAAALITLTAATAMYISSGFRFFLPK